MNNLDPLNILKTAEYVVNNSQSVFINPRKIKPISSILQKQIKNKKILTSAQFGKKTSPQLIFLENSVNFCFWVRRNEKKWTIEYPKGVFLDGWYGLTGCFTRALEEKIPILDCCFLEKLTLSQLKNIFRSCNQTEIPLIKKRLEFLKESANILKKHFKGDAKNIISKSNNNAIQIAKNIIKYFPSFSDDAYFNQQKIYFYKRAQICAYDFSLLPKTKITNINQLTAFADYKLPQILRSFGVISYRKDLAKKVDSYTLIQKESREEIEIRSAMIFACDLIAQELKTPAVIVESALWVLTQNKKRLKPYHRVLTTNY